MAILNQGPLGPYAGAFDEAAAWHLLRRCSLVPRREDVSAATAAGLARTLDRVLTPGPAPAPPVVAERNVDPIVPYGQTWVEAPYHPTIDVTPARYGSMTGWIVEHIYRADASLETKMWLFWINHFGVAADGDLRTWYTYYARLRSTAMGNFKALVRAVATEPLMLEFLNGRDNAASSPNENFARELLELFTIGKGPQVAPGDYTYYTEQDVRALARALTGWEIWDWYSSDPSRQPRAGFKPQRHDTGDKQLSHYFNNAVIADQGAGEIDAVIDHVFAHPACGRHLCRKLYRYFVQAEVSAETEATVIEPLADLLRASDWEVAPVLRALLSSEHFFDAEVRGVLIKSPLEFGVSLIQTTGLTFPAEPEDRYRLSGRLSWVLYDLKMLPWQPPSVSGWKAYYQAPVYHRSWINASTLQTRNGEQWLWIHHGLHVGGEKLAQADLLAFVATFENPSDPVALVAELAARWLPYPLTPPQAGVIKNYLIPGLPDFEWTVEYSDYLSDPGDEMLRTSVERKLRNAVYALVASSEFHLY